MKKAYLIPQMEEVEVKVQASLLAGSLAGQGTYDGSTVNPAAPGADDNLFEEGLGIGIGF